jgi:hypothetical protein
MIGPTVHGYMRNATQQKKNAMYGSVRDDLYRFGILLGGT